MGWAQVQVVEERFGWLAQRVGNLGSLGVAAAGLGILGERHHDGLGPWQAAGTAVFGLVLAGTHSTQGWVPGRAQVLRMGG